MRDPTGICTKSTGEGMKSPVEVKAEGGVQRIQRMHWVL